MSITNHIFGFLLALDSGSASGAAPWYNIPGFEAWKFFNLFLFVGVLIYILRRPLSQALKDRREGIRRELMRAQEERDAAYQKLAEVDARLERLDSEVAAIREQGQREAEMERERLARSTEEDIRKLQEQARREIETAGKQARQELRRYAAEQSVQLAEQIIRRDMRPEDDERLMKEYVEELGGVRG